MKIIFKSIIILFVSIMFMVVSLSAQNDKYIRVAIIQDIESLIIKIKGSYEITDSASGKILYRSKNLKSTVTSYKNGILIAGLTLNAAKISLKANDPEATLVNNRRFNGDIQLINKENGHLLVINYVELEDYVKGILYHEVSHYWPIEALKAQAVVCRTYAIYQINENKAKDYDLTADIYSQVYGGKTSERYRTNKAVDETKRQVLAYKDKVFPAYFHATCAGHTQDASLLWNIDIAPLKGVSCGFCKESPHFKWHSVLSLKKIKDSLLKSGYSGFEKIKDIVILAKDNSSRITYLKIITDKKDIKISAKDFREILKPNIIKSTNFTLTIVGEDAVFQGLGWGHGVGMCQWGAYFMAKKGYNYRQILEYYYPLSYVKTN
ncbi:MAG: hypothetical protein A2166_04410 [Omnitrophica WOR_2 bacterium RBG_13_41_10]|nr:MAG: hypothetical protein A2166_04410 [Omnitrophica WOR_2 bacterium RBG_13_41_10]